MIKLKNVERYNPNIEIGLTTDQVKKRIEEDLVNHDTTIPTKSIKRIIYENFFTLFNIINIILAICILCVKSYKKYVIFTNSNNKYCNKYNTRNSFKKVVDKLSIVASPKAKVIRNGKTEIIDIHQLVLDDIIILKTGEQIAADCKILSNEVEVNESCITGETNTIRKKK